MKTGGRGIATDASSLGASLGSLLSFFLLLALESQQLQKVYMSVYITSTSSTCIKFKNYSRNL